MDEKGEGRGDGLKAKTKGLVVLWSLERIGVIAPSRYKHWRDGMVTPQQWRDGVITPQQWRD